MVRIDRASLIQIKVIAWIRRVKFGFVLEVTVSAAAADDAANCWARHRVGNYAAVCAKGTTETLAGAKLLILLSPDPGFSLFRKPRPD